VSPLTAHEDVTAIIFNGVKDVFLRARTFVSWPNSIPAKRWQSNRRRTQSPAPTAGSKSQV
ncbi:MAG: hypothetical protein ABR501_15000, partial [Pyrinomonadaceae bacterium]